MPATAAAIDDAISALDDRCRPAITDACRDALRAVVADDPVVITMERSGRLAELRAARVRLGPDDPWAHPAGSWGDLLAARTPSGDVAALVAAHVDPVVDALAGDAVEAVEAVVGFDDAFAELMAGEFCDGWTPAEWAEALTGWVRGRLVALSWRVAGEVAAEPISPAVGG